MKKILLVVSNIITVVLPLLLFACQFFLPEFKNLANENLVIYIVVIFLSLLLSTSLHSFVHELFHMFFGLFCNMKFYSMRIGILMILKDGKRLKFKLAKSEYGGVCQMIPKNADKLYSRFSLYSIGGLIGSFILTLFTLIPFVFPNIFNLYISLFFVIMMPVNLYMFLNNVIPKSVGGMKTDGAVYLGLKNKDNSSKLAVNILAIQGFMFDGKMPNEIDENLFYNDIIVREDDVNFIILLNYRYIYHLSKKETDKALKVCVRINELLDYLPEIYQNNIESDFLFNACYLEKDLERAKDVFARCEKYLNFDESASNLRIRAVYAYYVLEDLLTAKSLILRAIAESEKFMIKGIGKFEKIICQEIYEEIVELISSKEEKERIENKIYITK